MRLVRYNIVLKQFYYILFIVVLLMATPAKVVFAPAMNNEMYNNAIVQDNIAKLKSYGYYFINSSSCFGSY